MSCRRRKFVADDSGNVTPPNSREIYKLKNQGFS